jgi:hypothetical protein
LTKGIEPAAKTSGKRIFIGMNLIYNILTALAFIRSDRPWLDIPLLSFLDLAKGIWTAPAGDSTMLCQS